LAFALEIFYKTLEFDEINLIYSLSI